MNINKTQNDRYINIEPAKSGSQYQGEKLCKCTTKIKIGITICFLLE